MAIIANRAFTAYPCDNENLHCNTAKDKIKLHDHSAGTYIYTLYTTAIQQHMYYIGLLAGIWPCGVITMIDELYKTESKSQVYGCLHGFVHSNPINTSSIGKLTKRIFK